MEHGDNYNSFQDPRGEVSGGKNVLLEYLLQRKCFYESELFLVDDYKLEKDNHNNISFCDENYDTDSGQKKMKKTSSSVAATGTDTNGVCNQIKNDSSLEAR